MTDSFLASKKKPVNGDSLRHELHGMIPELSSSDEEDEDDDDDDDENQCADSTSSSTHSSDEKDGVFDARSDMIRDIIGLTSSDSIGRITRWTEATI